MAWRSLTIVLSTAISLSILFPFRLASSWQANKDDIMDDRNKASFSFSWKLPRNHENNDENQHNQHYRRREVPPLPPRLTESETCTLANDNFAQASGVVAIVTGMEHSGTTLVSELLQSIPGVFGAFEGGFLLDVSPATMKRRKTFYQWLIQPVQTSLHWGLTPSQREYVTQATCFAEMYRRVHETSPLFQSPASSSSSNADSWIVDKTPSYLYNLTRIAQLTPQVPIVVTVKNFDAQLQSLLKRGVRKQAALRRIAAGTRALADAQAAFSHRIHVVPMDQLYHNPHATMAELFARLGNWTWYAEYLTMQALNAKGQALGRCQVPPFSTSITSKDAAASKVIGSTCQDNNGHHAGKKKQRMNRTKQPPNKHVTS